MNVNIFLPDTIKVGFQNRKDTFSGKLAYIIYYDNKGVLRKEKSWSDWKDNFIPSEEYENKPLSGFVLNKKAGGYQSGWNYRQSYIRVYDPRGFEIEITLKNLLFILDNCNCLKGKGLEGEFVYGWSGTELILLPINTQEYKEIQKFNEEIIKGKSITNKELIEGATYKDKKGNELVYLGKYDYAEKEINELKGKRHFFFNKNAEDVYWEIVSLVSVSNNHLILIDGKCNKDFNNYMFKMKDNKYSGYFDSEKYCYIPYSFDEFYDFTNKLNNIHQYFYIKNKNEYLAYSIYKIEDLKFLKKKTFINISNNFYGNKAIREEIEFKKEEVKKIFDKYNPYKLVEQ